MYRLRGYRLLSDVRLDAQDTIGTAMAVWSRQILGGSQSPADLSEKLARLFQRVRDRLGIVEVSKAEPKPAESPAPTKLETPPVDMPMARWFRFDAPTPHSLRSADSLESLGSFRFGPPTTDSPDDDDPLSGMILPNLSSPANATRCA